MTTSTDQTRLELARIKSSIDKDRRRERERAAETRQSLVVVGGGQVPSILQYRELLSSAVRAFTAPIISGIAASPALGVGDRRLSCTGNARSRALRAVQQQAATFLPLSLVLDYLRCTSVASPCPPSPARRSIPSIRAALHWPVVCSRSRASSLDPLHGMNRIKFAPHPARRSD